MRSVETNNAAGCMCNPSLAAMLGNYWCSLTRSGQLL